MENKNGNNPLLCDIETGMCALPQNTSSDHSQTESAREKPIKVIYYTDPICSSCWGIEPQLRKLKLEYGNDIEIEYRMGGLLPDWNYSSGGINKPSDVAHHWEEVSTYYDMPIDGGVWLEDPLDSSFPPSIAFKAAQMQDGNKAIAFMRVMREMVFLQKKNIAKLEHIIVAAEESGLDTNQLKKDIEGNAKQLFEEDLQLAKKLGVRGFPTMFFVDSEGNKEIVYGTKPYSAYENAVLKMYVSSKKVDYNKSWEFVFNTYNSLTAKEYSELTGTARKESEVYLDELTNQGVLEKTSTKNGALWTLK